MIRLRVWVSGVVDCGRGVGEICRIAMVVLLKKKEKEIVRIVVVMVLDLMMSRVDNLEWGVDDAAAAAA